MTNHTSESIPWEAGRPLLDQPIPNRLSSLLRQSLIEIRVTCRIRVTMDLNRQLVRHQQTVQHLL
jgi:hypothetical protein